MLSHTRRSNPKSFRSRSTKANLSGNADSSWSSRTASSARCGHGSRLVESASPHRELRVSSPTARSTATPSRARRCAAPDESVNSTTTRVAGSSSSPRSDRAPSGCGWLAKSRSMLGSTLEAGPGSSVRIESSITPPSPARARRHSTTCNGASSNEAVVEKRSVVESARPCSASGRHATSVPRGMVRVSWSVPTRGSNRSTVKAGVGRSSWG